MALLQPQEAGPFLSPIWKGWVEEGAVPCRPVSPLSFLWQPTL